MSLKKQWAAYLALALAAIVAVGFGLASAYALQQRITSLKAGEAHRQILTGEKCASCHTSKHKAPLVGACENCHVTKTWQSVSYTHASDYLNRDGHRSATCNSCHVNGGEIKDATCSTCHKTYAHKATRECYLCHQTTSWEASHKFPREHPRLKNSHAKKATCPDCHTIHNVRTSWYCADCHTKKKKHNAITRTTEHKKLQCVDCHRQTQRLDNLNKAVIKADNCDGCHAVPHQPLPRCERCHVKNSFKNKRYAHETWPLRGAHSGTECTKCHSIKQLGTAKGTTCAACHGVPHTGLSDCARCHTQTSFKPSTYSHDSSYRLVGAHRKLACSRCHPARQWASTKGSACSSCHGTKHGGLTACSTCHTNVAWKPSKFNHSATYPLTGAHKRVACSKCHPSNNYVRSKGRTCVACHGTKHGDQTKCQRCHTTKAWQPIKAFAHTSQWPLVGQHKYVECVGCHKKLDFGYTPLRCVDCHANLTHGMSNCESCHTPVSWSIVSGHGG